MTLKWKAVAVIGVVLTITTVVGFLFGTMGTHSEGKQNVAVTLCDDLGDYDFKRQLHRVERIKRTEMSVNLSICTERSANGISTISPSNRFAYIEEPGLKFFELNTTKEKKGRSSIGHTWFTPGGDQIHIQLANESVVSDVSWISYEALVAHEMSHAIDDSSLIENTTKSDSQQQIRRTTDYLLAQMASSEGIAMHVAELYIEKYTGHLNVTALRQDDSSWKRQMMKSLYYEGYKYSSGRNVRSYPTAEQIETTTQLLHPERTSAEIQLPDRPMLRVNDVEHTRVDSVGELFIKEVLRVKGNRPEVAVRAADGWTGDRMDYYQIEDGILVSWRTVWKAESDRREFLMAYDNVYDFTMVDSVEHVQCNSTGRFLATKKNSVTIVQCPS